MNKAEIEKILKNQFLQQWTSSVKWTNQDVVLAVMECLNQQPVDKFKILMDELDAVNEVLKGKMSIQEFKAIQLKNLKNPTNP